MTSDLEANLTKIEQKCAEIGKVFVFFEDGSYVFVDGRAGLTQIKEKFSGIRLALILFNDGSYVFYADESPLCPPPPVANIKWPLDGC